MPLPLPQADPLPVVITPPGMERPTLVIKPPGAGPIAVPQITDQEKLEQAILQKERQIIDELVRNQIALAHAKGKASAIKQVIVMNGPVDAMISRSATPPPASEDKVALVGIEPEAMVSKQLDGFFGSPMTPESEQRLLETVQNQLAAHNTKSNVKVWLAGWWPEQGVVAVSVVPGG